MHAQRDDGRHWWQDPAWLSLFLTLVLHLCVGAYLYGRMAQKVDMLEHQNDMILQHLLQHMGEGPAR